MFAAGELAMTARDLALWDISTIDQTMVDCILALYRSATEVGKEWYPDFHDIPKPGAVIVPADDPFLSDEGAKASAAKSSVSSGNHHVSHRKKTH